MCGDKPMCQNSKRRSAYDFVRSVHVMAQHPKPAVDSLAGDHVRKARVSFPEEMREFAYGTA